MITKRYLIDSITKLFQIEFKDLNNFKAAKQVDHFVLDIINTINSLIFSIKEFKKFQHINIKTPIFSILGNNYSRYDKYFEFLELIKNEKNFNNFCINELEKKIN